VANRTEEPGNKQSVSGSFLDLIKLNKALKCTYSTEQEGTKVTGTTYVSGSKMRSDSEVVTSAAGTITSHMISDGTWIYSWGSAQPQGIKMKVPATQPQDGTSPDKGVNGSGGYKDLQQQYSYNCENWSVDASKFDVPADITFMEFDLGKLDPNNFIPSNSATKEFTVSAANYTFDLTEIRVKKGDTVQLTLKNNEGFHDWVIDEFSARTGKLQVGQEETITFVADKTGTFEYYCSVGTHRAMGMKGNLTVE